MCNSRTHHDATVEALLTDGDDNVLADTFQDLAARDDEAVRVAGNFVPVDGDALRGLWKVGYGQSVPRNYDKKWTHSLRSAYHEAQCSPRTEACG